MSPGSKRHVLFCMLQPCTPMSHMTMLDVLVVSCRPQAAMKIDALRAGAASALGAVLAEGVPAGGGLPALERDEGAGVTLQGKAGGLEEGWKARLWRCVRGGDRGQPVPVPVQPCSLHNRQLPTGVFLRTYVNQQSCPPPPHLPLPPGGVRGMPQSWTKPAA